MSELLKKILTFRMLKYLIVFVFTSFLYNYISHAIRHKLESGDFSGIIKIINFEIHISYLFIVVFTLVSSGLYRYFSLQEKIDKVIFKS